LFVVAGGVRFLPDSNQPRHQPNPAVITNAKTIAIATASFNASRRIRRATRKKIAPTISSTRTTATGVTASTFTCLLPTAYCLCFPFLVTCAHGCFDVAAHIEVAFEFDAEGIAGIHKIFQDDVDDVLVKDFHFTE